MAPRFFALSKLAPEVVSTPDLGIREMVGVEAARHQGRAPGSGSYDGRAVLHVAHGVDRQVGEI